MEICKSEICTGCAVCVDVCSKHCITMQPDKLASMHPVVNRAQCTNCGLCQKVCPNNNPIELHKSTNVYAAWSNDEIQRISSASGGVAYELYKHIINTGGVGAGVTLDEKGCHFILIKNEDDISRTKNSKYVFVDADGIYRQIKNRLSKGQKVLFIGLPCHVAGLYSYLRGKNEGLYTVDIICHGLAPYEYLRQHISGIEKRNIKKVKNISFRNPSFGTGNYTFTLSDEENRIFYSKKVKSNDAYQLGYHHALIYRENCYQCKYARQERVGDLTIGDFSGLGREKPFSYERGNLNCVLCNTDKGNQLIEDTKDAISYVERPREEAFNYERQLNSPSVRHKHIDTFHRIYSRTQSFRKATNGSLWNDRLNVLMDADNIAKWTIRLPKRIFNYIRRKL